MVAGSSGSVQSPATARFANGRRGGLGRGPMPWRGVARRSRTARAGGGATGQSPGRGTYYLNGGAAYYRTYATSDGRHVVLGAIEPKFWRNFCEAAGRPEWITRQPEPMPQIALGADIATFFASLTLVEATARFEAVDCCFSPVLGMGEALAQPQISERNLVRPGTSIGDLQALFPVLIDGVAPDSRPAMQMAGATTAPGSAIPKQSVNS